MRRLQKAGQLFVALAFLSTSCGDASGCDDFNPTSERFDDGRSGPASLEVTDRGGLYQPDIGGSYWNPVDGQRQFDPESERVLNGQARLLDDGTMQVELDSGELLFFEGPIGCD